jgi:hypothetical protein
MRDQNEPDKRPPNPPPDIPAPPQQLPPEPMPPQELPPVQEPDLPPTGPNERPPDLPPQELPPCSRLSRRIRSRHGCACLVRLKFSLAWRRQEFLAAANHPAPRMVSRQSRVAAIMAAAGPSQSRHVIAKRKQRRLRRGYRGCKATRGLGGCAERVEPSHGTLVFCSPAPTKPARLQKSDLKQRRRR